MRRLGGFLCARAVILTFARYPTLMYMTRHPRETEEVLSVLSSEKRMRLQSACES